MNHPNCHVTGDFTLGGCFFWVVILRCLHRSSPALGAATSVDGSAINLAFGYRFGFFKIQVGQWWFSNSSGMLPK